MMMMQPLRCVAVLLVLASLTEAFVPAVSNIGYRSGATSKVCSLKGTFSPILRRATVGLRAEAETENTARAVGEKDSGRHLDDTRERSDAVSDIYGPFWEAAAEILQKRLGVELEPYPIPDGYVRKEATMGKGKRESHVYTQSYAFQTKKLRQIRAAHVNGGAALQVLNFVIFPHMNYDLPFLGLDLVTLPGGHLIAIDMQPLFQSDEYKAKYSGQKVLDMHAKHAENLPWGGDFPEEAKQYFSPAFLWTRPQEDKEVETHVFDAFKDYLNSYLDFVEAAQPETDAERLEAVKERQIAYLQYRAEKDPARGMFTRIYGPEWTEEYIHGFLFDLEEKIEAGEYKVGETLPTTRELNFKPTPVG